MVERRRKRRRRLPSKCIFCHKCHNLSHNDYLLQRMPSSSFSSSFHHHQQVLQPQPLQVGPLRQVGLFLLLFSATSDEKSYHRLRFNEAIVINLELSKDIINLSLVEFVTEVSQCMSEHFCFDFALNLVGFECTDNKVIGVIGSTSHLLLEHFDHGIECA